MAIEISKQQAIEPNLILVDDQSYSSPLINYVEIDNIGGVNKTKFFTTVITNVKVGNWVYIVDGYYDNSRIGKIKSTRKGANGWKVLKVNNCQVTLDIDWVGTLPYKEDVWDNFIKVWVANQQEDLDTFVQQNTFEYPGTTNSVTTKYDINKNSIIYIDKTMTFDRPFGVVTNTLLPNNYNGNFTYSIGGWPSNSYNNGSGTATFSIATSSNQLQYISQTNASALTITSSIISLTPNAYYDVSFDVAYYGTIGTVDLYLNLGSNQVAPFSLVSYPPLLGTASYALRLQALGATSFSIYVNNNNNSCNLLLDNLLIKSSFPNMNQGFYKAVNGVWTDVTYGFTSGNIPGLSSSNNSHILPIDNFTYSGTGYKANNIYKYSNSWIIDDDYKPSYIGKANFRSGSFSGTWNDGVFGSYDDTIKWSSGYWTNGVMINSYFDGQMDSKTDYSPGLKIYYTSLKDNLPKTNLDVNNYFGNGLNYIIDSVLHSGSIKNGSIYNSDLSNPQSTPVILQEINGTTYSHNTLTMSGGSIYESKVDSINSLSTKIYNSFVTNTKLSGTKLFDSYVKKSVANNIEWNTDGSNILRYELNNVIVRTDIIVYTHKFYISKDNWLRLKTDSSLSLKDVLFNSVYPDSILEDVHFLDWKSLWSRNNNNQNGFILRSIEQNKYNCDLVYDSSLGYWVNNFTINLNPGYSIDYCSSYHIDVTDPSENWKSQMPYLTSTNDLGKGNDTSIKSINSAYLLPSRFESGIIKNSIWKSGFATNYDILKRRVGFGFGGITQSNLLMNVTGSGGSYSVTAHLQGNDNELFYKNIIDDDFYYLNNIYYFDSTISLSLEGWYKVVSSSISTLYGETNYATLKPITGELVATTSFTPVFGHYIDNKINIDGSPDPTSFYNIHTNRLYITNSNIYSGSFRGPSIYSSNLINNPVLDNDVLQLTLNKLKISSTLEDNRNNVNNGSTYYNSSILGITWSNGLLFRSIWNNSKPFDNGLSKQNYWVNGTFNNGKFIESDLSGGLFKIWISNPLSVAGYVILWGDGIFNNGEFFKSRFKKGIINNGKLWYSTIESNYGDIIINNGHFGDISIDQSLTQIKNVGNYPNQFNINYAIVDNAMVEGMIDWYNGVFNNGTFFGLDASLSNSAPVWHTGLFNNGNFSGNAQWLDGEFRGGRFTSVKVDIPNASGPNYLKMSGIGHTQSNYSWLSGTFSGGVFGEEDKYMKELQIYLGNTYRASWYNGVFLGGKFVGRVWNDGVFVNGEFEGSFTQSIATNKISQFNILTNGDMLMSLGSWELFNSDSTTCGESIDLVLPDILKFSIPDGGCFGSGTYYESRNTTTILQYGKTYKIAIKIDDLGGDDIFAIKVSLGGNSKVFGSIGIYEDYIVCGISGEVSIGLYIDGLNAYASIDYLYIYEVLDTTSISLQDAIDYYSPERENIWYGVFRTGSVVDSVKKTNGIYAKNDLPAGSPLLKENFKVNNPVRFKDMLFVDGDYNNPLAKMHNSIWLGGKFNNGLFDSSYFNPYVKRWDYLEWTGAISTLGTNYSGTFNYPNTIWVEGYGYNPSGPSYATFSVQPSNILVFDGEFESVGLTVTNSSVTLTKYVQYDIAFDIVSYIQPYNTLYTQIVLGTNKSAKYFGTGSYTFSLTCLGATSLSIEVKDDDEFYGHLAIDNLVITSTADTTVPYGYNLNTYSCIWNDGVLDGGSEFSISEWNNGLFKRGSMYGAQFNKGTAYYINAYNTIWKNGRWRNGNWYGADILFATISETATYPQNKYTLLTDPTSAGSYTNWNIQPGAYNDQLVVNMLRNGTASVFAWDMFKNTSPPAFKKKYDNTTFTTQNNSEIVSVNNMPSLTIVTSSISTLDGMKLHIGYDKVIKLPILTTTVFATQSIQFNSPVNGYPSLDSTLGELVNSKLGNGSFKSGIWENGVWNNGTRSERSYGNTDVFIKFNDVYLAYEVNPTLWTVILAPTREEYDKFIINNFTYNIGIGDDILIGNLVLLDINGNRQVNKQKTKIIEVDLDNGNIIFEIRTKFPLRSIERDSKYHLMYVTKNIWLNGTFLSGLFSGVWGDGRVNGYPAITQFTESHWIDGELNGAWFNSSTGTYSNFTGLSTYNYNTSVFQKGFINNRLLDMAYSNVLDFQYSSYSTTNNNLTYNDYTTEDVLEANMYDEFTTLRQSWFMPLTYQYGTKYKVYNNLLNNDISQLNYGSSHSLASELGWYTNDQTGMTYSQYINVKVGDLADYDLLYAGLPLDAILGIYGHSTANFSDNYSLGFSYSVGTVSNPFYPQGLFNINNSISKYRYGRVKYDLVNTGTWSVSNGAHISGWNKNYNTLNSAVNDLSSATGSYAHYHFGQNNKQPLLLTRNFNGRIDNIFYEEIDRIPLPLSYKYGYLNKLNLAVNNPITMTAAFVDYNKNTD